MLMCVVMEMHEEASMSCIRIVCIIVITLVWTFLNLSPKESPSNISLNKEVSMNMELKRFNST